MKVERGLRRVTWVMSVLVWLTVTFTVYRSLRKSSAHAYLAVEWNDPGLWVDRAAGLMAGTAAAIIPWVVFLVGRWVVRGFQADRYPFIASARAGRWCREGKCTESRRN